MYCHELKNNEISTYKSECQNIHVNISRNNEKANRDEKLAETRGKMEDTKNISEWQGKREREKTLVRNFSIENMAG